MVCKWCDFDNESLIIKEYDYWKLSVAESQILLGWTHASLKRHIHFFEELKDEELLELRSIVNDIKRALRKTFKPDWFNIMQLGNMTKRLHFQLVPRYKEKRVFAGRVFIDKTFGKPITDKWIVENSVFLEKLRDHIRKEIK